MSSDDFGEKSELPTDRRREKAREEGQVAHSKDFVEATVLIAAAFAMLFFGRALTVGLAILMQRSLSASPWLAADLSHVGAYGFSTIQYLAKLLLPWFGLLILAGLLGNWSQAGLVWFPGAIAMKWEHIDPMKGIQRIVSFRAIFVLFASFAKLSILGGIAFSYIWWRIPQYLALSDQGIAIILGHSGQAILELSFALSVGLVITSLADFGFQYWRHEESLKMTKQEIKDEMKESDGDPEIRQRRKQLHREMLLMQQLGQVSTADGVITNPTEIAVAFRYDPQTMLAPTVVAKGTGIIAARIRRIAAEHGVPIIERKPLARALYRRVKVGEPIPEDMYQVFLDIMKYIYEITGKKPKL